jgi:hypothetical protein
MDYKKWREEVSVLLKEKEQQLSIPKGENCLGGENANTFHFQSTGLPPNCVNQLAKFYSVCDGFAWPDIFNGYFLMRSNELGIARHRYVPYKIKKANGSYSDVLMIGSKGGGEMFVIKSNTGEILMLPGSSFEDDNVYDDLQDRAKCVARDFNSFLVILMSDLKAYVKGNLDHKFITD